MSEDILFTRRSIRKYIKGKQVEDEKVEYMLKAAMYAPSANNRRNWEFIVIKNRETLDKIMDFHPYAKMLETAPMAIIVCGDLSDESGKLYWQQNCSAALENMMLAAKAKDLGTVWIGLAPREERMNEVISRELIYTAITRAKDYVKLICDRNILREGVNRDAVRESGLSLRIVKD